MIIFLNTLSKNLITESNYSFKHRRSDMECSLECSICLESINCADSHSLINCNHCFHRGCIVGWIKTIHTNCPNCRSSLGIETLMQLDIKMPPELESKFERVISDTSPIAPIRIMPRPLPPLPPLLRPVNLSPNMIRLQPSAPPLPRVILPSVAHVVAPVVAPATIIPSRPPLPRMVYVETRNIIRRRY